MGHFTSDSLTSLHGKYWLLLKMLEHGLWKTLMQSGNERKFMFDQLVGIL